jgi:hypothetical protein
MTENETITMGLDEAGLKHIKSMHRLGRIGVLGAIIVMLGMPTVAGIYYDALPSPVQVLTAAVGLLALFVPAAISETIAFSPVFGSSYYLAQITGNIQNLKLPVAKNALEILDVEEGTEDADIVTSIAVSVSSFATIAIIAIGVLLLQPLKPVLEAPVVRTATGYIVPALFGALLMASLSPNLGGGITCKGRAKGLIVPAIITALVNIFFYYILRDPMKLAIYQGFLMLALLPIAWFWQKYLYKSGAIKVYLPGEQK